MGGWDLGGYGHIGPVSVLYGTIVLPGLISNLKIVWVRSSSQERSPVITWAGLILESSVAGAIDLS